MLKDHDYWENGYIAYKVPCMDYDMPWKWNIHVCTCMGTSAQSKFERKLVYLSRSPDSGGESGRGHIESDTRGDHKY